jgi:hypothetical protein
MWQEYYRHILTKVIFSKLFGSLGGYNSRIDSLGC